MKPLVSVVMPAYNHQRFISEAIDSVLSQSISDIELIIVDDCSKDNTTAIIKSFINQDDRIKTLFHMENLGIAKTINDGMNLAQGKYLSFIASDDVWVKDKIEKQIEILKYDSNLIVWCEGDIIDSESNLTGEKFTVKIGGGNKNKKKSGNIFSELLKGNFIFGSSLILKRENTKGIYYDEKYVYLNDYKYVVDLAKKYNFLFINTPLAKYRIHGQNVTQSKKEKCYEDDILLRKYFFEQYHKEISRYSKSYLYYGISRAYDALDNKKEMRQYLYKSFVEYPLNRNTLICLIYSIYCRFRLLNK
jgi:glycosyltransferase involved in cell wall biosynthesis